MLTDPIAALATPPGRSALAVVRLSGRGAFAVAARVVPSFTATPPRTAQLASFVAGDGTLIDRGLYTAFPDPHSYTGEDLVEFSCHGGLVVPVRLLAALLAAGARAALPGEFTRRAVLNGTHGPAAGRGGGRPDRRHGRRPRRARRCISWTAACRAGWPSSASALLDTESLLSYEIDFPEEDDGPVAPERIVGRMTAPAGADRALARHRSRGRAAAGRGAGGAGGSAQRG